MALFLDILHMIIAASLSLLGLGYERDQDCETVQYLPAAYGQHQLAQYDAQNHVEIAECGYVTDKATLHTL